MFWQPEQKSSSAQVVEASVTNNSSFQNYPHPDDHTRQTTDTPGFKPLWYYGMTEFWWRSFGLKITVLSRATFLVSIGNNINSRVSPVALPTISRALLPMTSKANKLPLETEPVARDNNTIFTLKRGDQTFVRLTQLIIVVFIKWVCLRNFVIELAYVPSTNHRKNSNERTSE